MKPTCLCGPTFHFLLSPRLHSPCSLAPWPACITPQLPSNPCYSCPLEALSPALPLILQLEVVLYHCVSTPTKCILVRRSPSPGGSSITVDWGYWLVGKKHCLFSPLWVTASLSSDWQKEQPRTSASVGTSEGPYLPCKCHLFTREQNIKIIFKMQ